MLPKPQSVLSPGTMLLLRSALMLPSSGRCTGRSARPCPSRTATTYQARQSMPIHPAASPAPSLLRLGDARRVVRSQPSNFIAVTRSCTHRRGSSLRTFDELLGLRRSRVNDRLALGWLVRVSPSVAPRYRWCTEFASTHAAAPPNARSQSAHTDRETVEILDALLLHGPSGRVGSGSKTWRS